MNELEQKFIGACGANVKVGTNGYHGGDAGHGGFAFVQIENDCGDYHFDILINNEAGIKITACGDEEIDILIAMLEEASSMLRKLGVGPDKERINQMKKAGNNYGSSTKIVGS